MAMPLGADAKSSRAGARTEHEALRVRLRTIPPRPPRKSPP